MLNHISIKDSFKDGFLSISLFNLLNHLDNKVERYYWSIYELSATAKKNSNINLAEIQDKVNNSTTGFHTNWKKLLFLAQKLEQVIELILVAAPKEECFTSFNDTNMWRSKYPIVIEIIDGSFWEVYSQSTILIEALSKIYKNVTIETLHT